MSLIASEFKKSMLRSIEKFSKQIGCEQENIQIAFELSAKNETVHKVLKEYTCIKAVELDELLFLNPIYSIFQSKIPPALNKCLCHLRNECGSEFITVFVTKSKKNDEKGKKINDVRVMLFVKGKHEKDISIEDFINL